MKFFDNNSKINLPSWLGFFADTYNIMYKNLINFSHLENMFFHFSENTY